MNIIHGQLMSKHSWTWFTYYVDYYLYVDEFMKFSWKSLKFHEPHFAGRWLVSIKYRINFYIFLSFLFQIYSTRGQLLIIEQYDSLETLVDVLVLFYNHTGLYNIKMYLSTVGMFLPASWTGFYKLSCLWMKKKLHYMFNILDWRKMTLLEKNV